MAGFEISALHRPRGAPVLIRVTQSTGCVFGSRASASAWMKHCRNAWSSIHTAGMRRTRSWLVCIAPLCTNGLLCRLGDFGIVRVPHRKSVITDVVAGRLEIASQFGRISASVSAMVARVLTVDEQIAFARRAFEISWANAAPQPPMDRTSSCRCAGRRMTTRRCGMSSIAARKR